MGSKLVCAWSRDKVLAVLTARVVQAAMSGRPTPVAAAVLARVEAAS